MRRAGSFLGLAVLLAALASTNPAAAAGPPQIPNLWVTSVTSSSAVLHGEVNPEGSSTHYRFQYIALERYEENLSSGIEGFSGARSAPSADVGLEAATIPLPVSVALAAPSNTLAAATSYRFRILATNQAGTSGDSLGVFSTRVAGPPGGLPDARAWELVSPVDKGGGSIARPETLFGGGDIQAAASGGALTYGSGTAFADPLGVPPVSQYLSRRGPEGWSTANLSPPIASGVYGDLPDGAPYRLFSSELDLGLLYGGDPCRGQAGCPAPAPPLPNSGAPGAYRDYYLGSGSAPAFRSLLTLADLAHTSVPAEDFRLTFTGATPGLGSVVLTSCAALTADATEVAGEHGCDPAAQNLYAWKQGQLRLINLLPAQGTGTPGARLASQIGAISADGARVYWVANDGSLYVNDSGQSKPLDESGEADFQLASEDGSAAFYLKSGHLYRYQPQGEVNSDLTPSGGVLGVLAVSGDGSRVYYQNTAGLQLWHQGAKATIAPGQVATPSDYPPSLATTRLSADGTVLAFLSDSSLGGFDNTDADTGQPDTEVYLYDSLADSLICASCQPTGERPHGSSAIPGTIANGSTRIYRPRALSADGRRLFFDSDDHLLGTDTDGAADVYQWEARGEGDCQANPGCVSLISGGRGEGGEFLDASAEGSDVFFITGDSLVPSDPGSLDAYDARIDGGLPEPQQPIACEGDSCQPLPSPPQDPTAGTSFPGPGNPPPKYFKEHRKRHHKKHHRRKHTHRSHHQRGRR